MQRDGRVLNVLCFDQFGENITALSEITWRGKFEPIDSWTVEGRSGMINVMFAYDQTIRTDEIDLGSDEIEDEFPVAVTLIFLAFICAFAGGMAIYLINTGKKGTQDPTENMDGAHSTIMNSKDVSEKNCPEILQSDKNHPK